MWRKNRHLLSEQGELEAEIRSYLGISDVKGVRELIRYDMEHVSEETYRKALVTVFSEPPVDDVYEENFELNGARTFSVEFLPDSLTRERTLPSSV